MVPTVGVGQRQIVVGTIFSGNRYGYEAPRSAFRPECHRCDGMIRGELDIQEDHYE